MKCVAIISYSECALFGDGVTLRSGGRPYIEAQIGECAGEGDVFVDDIEER